MNILIINPNTTASMTDKIRQVAEAVCFPGTVITAVQPEMGPVSIEGYYDEVFSIPGLITEIRRHPEADAIVLACFDDSGLDAARCITDKPVLGIGEAGFHTASLIAHKFAVVTTLSRSVAALEHNLLRYGLERRCAGVRATDIPVLELEDPESDAYARISREIAMALRDDHADAVVLGCAGMTDLAEALQKEHGVPVVDGVVSAVKMAEGLAALGLRTSKRGAYAWPGQKPYQGAMAGFAP